MHDLGPTPTDALACLRSFTAGVLVYGDRALGLRFVIDPRSGRLLMPLPADVLEAHDHVLHLPDERAPSLEALLSLSEAGERDAGLIERWRAYHGEPSHACWRLAAVESARMAGMVYDSPVFSVPNPLAADQPRLCRTLNADPARLADICAASTHTRPEHPVALGIDPDGLDARARFGVIRVAFPRRADDAEDALAMLDELARRGAQ
ncbi:MAG: hypothetical protein KIS87_07820 [Phycisphaeraceae bacterium]|nr:hypothetical protein [Phycisphaeraceae bacterium]